MRICLAFAVAAVLSGCGGRGFTPREGDLLFQVAGESEMSAAIADATARRDSLRFVHVAIALGPDSVVEASAERGVAVTPLSRFVGEAPGVVVMRVDGGFPANDAVARARARVGEPYDWSYLPDNGKTYCSELVYDCFLDSAGRRMFEARPMNFLDASGHLPDFWRRLFDELGEPVPQGVPGTNPTDMSRSPLLREVHRYF